VTPFPEKKKTDGRIGLWKTCIRFKLTDPLNIPFIQFNKTKKKERKQISCSKPYFLDNNVDGN
jgi:hypothetical protein